MRCIIKNREVCMGFYRADHHMAGGIAGVEGV